MKDDAIARLVYALAAIYIAVSSFAAPCPAALLMFSRDGFWGYAAAAGTAALAVVVVADVATNDWLPERFMFRWVRGRRHWLYASTAGCYVTPLFAASAYVVDAAHFSFYVGMALFGLVLGYRETRANRETAWAD
ncbi:MAG: hypothetical protein WDN30_07875 [Pararobbsia sp.]